MKTKPEPDLELVTVFRTQDPGLAGVVKSLLDSARIDYSMRDEALLNVLGWPSSGRTSALGEAQFQVREADAQSALALLAQLSSK